MVMKITALIAIIFSFTKLLKKLIYSLRKQAIRNWLKSKKIFIPLIFMFRYIFFCFAARWPKSEISFQVRSPHFLIIAEILYFRCGSCGNYICRITLSNSKYSLLTTNGLCKLLSIQS